MKKNNNTSNENTDIEREIDLIEDWANKKRDFIKDLEKSIADISSSRRKVYSDIDNIYLSAIAYNYYNNGIRNNLESHEYKYSVEIVTEIIKALIGFYLPKKPDFNVLSEDSVGNDILRKKLDSLITQQVLEELRKIAEFVLIYGGAYVLIYNKMEGIVVKVFKPDDVEHDGHTNEDGSITSFYVNNPIAIGSDIVSKWLYSETIGFYRSSSDYSLILDSGKDEDFNFSEDYASVSGCPLVFGGNKVDPYDRFYVVSPLQIYLRDFVALDELYISREKIRSIASKVIVEGAKVSADYMQQLIDATKKWGAAVIAAPDTNTATDFASKMTSSPDPNAFDKISPSAISEMSVNTLNVINAEISTIEARIEKGVGLTALEGVMMQYDQKATSAVIQAQIATIRTSDTMMCLNSIYTQVYNKFLSTILGNELFLEKQRSKKMFTDVEYRLDVNNLSKIDYIVGQNEKMAIADMFMEKVTTSLAGGQGVPLPDGTMGQGLDQKVVLLNLEYEVEQRGNSVPQKTLREVIVLIKEYKESIKTKQVIALADLQKQSDPNNPENLMAIQQLEKEKQTNDRLQELDIILKEEAVVKARLENDKIIAETKKIVEQTQEIKTNTELAPALVKVDIKENSIQEAQAINTVNKLTIEKEKLMQKSEPSV